MSKESVPRGIRNNNPGNIRVSSTAWIGKLYDISDEKAFERFETMEYGIRALLVILRTYINKYKLHTIEGIIRRFAPSTENDTEAYIKSVCKETGFERNMTLFFDLEDMLPVVVGIIKHENGGLYGITNEQIEKAWEAT
jgi:hypothetical protein